MLEFDLDVLIPALVGATADLVRPSDGDVSRLPFLLADAACEESATDHTSGSVTSN